MSLPDKLGDHDSGTGRLWILEVGFLGRVHAIEQSGIGDVDLHADDIGRRHPRLFENGIDVFQRLFHFGAGKSHR